MCFSSSPGTGFVALAAQVKIDLSFTPVPITGQTFAVVLVGASLGALLGLASLASTSSSARSARRSTPTASTAGTSSPARPAATSSASSSPRASPAFSPNNAGTAVSPRRSAAMLTGNVVIYLFGLPWLAAKIDTGPRGHARGGPLPVRRRRPPQALSRRRAAARGVAPGRPLQGLIEAREGRPRALQGTH